VIPFADNKTQSTLAEAYEQELQRFATRGMDKAQSQLAAVFEKVQHPAKRAFLLSLCAFPGVTRAAESAGVHPSTTWQWRQGRQHESEEESAAFIEGYAIATRLGVEFAEQEAWRRSIEGVIEPVFGSLGGEKGENGAGIIGHKIVRSDAMLQFMLKGHAPQTYRERHEVSGPNGGPIESKVIVLPFNDRSLQDDDEFAAAATAAEPTVMSLPPRDDNG
jgi:hypothetical protein